MGGEGKVIMVDVGKEWVIMDGGREMMKKVVKGGKGR